jgi:hypothetical protein
MKAKWVGGVVVVGLLILALGATLAPRGVTAQGDAEPSKGGPHYTVVETEGHNLIVTDNRTDTLYFYTIDKDAQIGSDLKLRGQVDLKQVGRGVVKPSNVKLRK